MENLLYLETIQSVTEGVKKNKKKHGFRHVLYFDDNNPPTQTWNF